jgi:hypothetical protein
MLLLHQGPFVSLGLAHAQSGAQTVSAYPAIAYANGVQASIVNQTTGAPTWIGTPAPTFTAGSTTPYNPTVFISDYNVITDVVTVDNSGAALPGWLTLVSNQLIPNGTQTSADTFSGLKLKVSRSGGAYVSSPSITVSVNAFLGIDLPTWNSAPVVNVVEGFPSYYDIRYYLDYYDGNADVISLAPTSVSLPAGVQVYGNDLLFSGSLTPQTITGVELQVSRNGGTNVPSGKFSIVVTPAGTPVWDYTPNPIFVAGTTWDYDVGQCIRNYSAAIDVVSLSGGSAALPSGVTLSGSVLHGNGSQTAGSVSGIILQVSRRSATPVTSSAFSIVTNVANSITWAGVPRFSSKWPVYEDNYIFVEGLLGTTTDSVHSGSPYDLSTWIAGFNSATDSVQIVSGPSWMYVDSVSPWLIKATGTQRSTDTTPKLVLRCLRAGLHQDTPPLIVEVRSMLDASGQSRQILRPTFSTHQNGDLYLKIGQMMLGGQSFGYQPFTFNTNPYPWLKFKDDTGTYALYVDGTQPGNGNYPGVVITITTPLGQSINFPCSITIRDPDILWNSMPSSFTLQQGSTQDFQFGPYLRQLPSGGIDKTFDQHITLSGVPIPSWMQWSSSVFWCDGTEVNGNSVSGLKLNVRRWELTGPKMGMVSYQDSPSISVNVVARTSPPIPIPSIGAFQTPTIDAGFGFGPRRLIYGKHARWQDVGARNTDYIYVMGGDGDGQYWGGYTSGAMDTWATFNVMTGQYTTDYFYNGTVGHPVPRGLDGAYSCWMPSRGKYFCAGYSDEFGVGTYPLWVDYTYSFNSNFSWYDPVTHQFEDKGARPNFINVSGSTGEGIGITYDSSRDKIVTAGINVMHLFDPNPPFTIYATIALDTANILHGGGTEPINSAQIFGSHMEYDPITDHVYWAQNGCGRLYRTHLGTHVTEKLCPDLIDFSGIPNFEAATQPVIWMLDSLYCLVVYPASYVTSQDQEVSWKLVNLQTGAVTSFNGYNAEGAAATGGIGSNYFNEGCYNKKNRRIMLTGGFEYEAQNDGRSVVTDIGNGGYFHLYDASGLPLR